MCSFLVSNVPFSQQTYSKANHIQRLRGPDKTNFFTRDSISFVHNLLSITGKFTTQPFVQADITCVYNGEIYNSSTFGDYSSDGECIIDCYKISKQSFPNLLDGEFAICIHDAVARKFVLATDPFGTKPLYFSIKNENIGIASYPSALQGLGFESICRVPANSLVTIAIDTLKINIIRPVWEFNLQQFKVTLDHWEAAFERAILKRTSNLREQIFICLSSGYDSGAIACALSRQGVDFKAFSFTKNEDKDVLRARLELLGKRTPTEELTMSMQDYNENLDFLTSYAEPGNYSIASTRLPQIINNRSFLNDNASIGLSMICSRAKNEGRKVCFSGQGADEVLSDYSINGRAIYDHSNFNGLFPEKLEAIFPWLSFYGSTQSSYLLKEEHVAGAFGIETRYPFLDKTLVQEYLNLDHQIKNSRYKVPLYNYLKSYNFPIAENSKAGFVPI